MRSRADTGRTQLRSEFDHLTAHIERMWGQLLGGRPYHPQFSPPLLAPAVDVYETDQEVVVIVETPGMRDQDVLLEVDSDTLTIRGEKRRPGEDCSHTYYQMEITSGPFQRSLRLPSEVDPQGANLRYDDGYIQIRLPRVSRRLERRVRINVHR